MKCSDKDFYYAEISGEDQQCVSTCPNKMYMTMEDGIGKYCVTECTGSNILQRSDAEHDVLCMTTEEAA